MQKKRWVVATLLTSAFASFITACGTAPDRATFKAGKAAAGSKDSNSLPYSGTSGDQVAGTKTPDTKEASGTTTEIPSTGVPETKDPVVVVPVPVPDVKTGDMPVNCKSFSWESIKKPEDAACFTSTASAIASLPDTVKPFWILMKNSRSAQKSTLEKPRVIVTSPDGSFMVGAATDAGSRADLEVAVFDYEKSEWQFAGVDFSTTPPTVEKELCKTCHGQERQHPIWTQYGGWTGAFAANNELTADESNFLKKVVAAGSDIPEILKSLKYRAASSYNSGSRLAPATKFYGGEENGQVLNYVSMQKAAQSTAARISKDASIQVNDMLAMSSDISCGTKNGTLKKFGYSIDRDLNFTLEGVDRGGDMFNGRFRASDYLAAELIAKAFEKDPSLKAKLSAAASAFADPRYKYFTTKSLAEHNAFMATAKTSLRSLMSDYLDQKIGGALGGTDHCSAIKNLLGN